MITITIADNAFIVGLVLFVMLYTTIEIFATPFPVTKYDITKSSSDIVNDKSIPAYIPGLIIGTMTFVSA